MLRMRTLKTSDRDGPAIKTKVIMEIKMVRQKWLT